MSSLLNRRELVAGLLGSSMLSTQALGRVVLPACKSVASAPTCTIPCAGSGVGNCGSPGFAGQCQGAGPYQIYLMDDGGHFYFSGDPTFSSWAYAVNDNQNGGDTWPDMNMAINDMDYKTLMAIREPNTGNPAQYVKASDFSKITTAPQVSLAGVSSGGADADALRVVITGNAGAILFGMGNPANIPPALSSDAGVSWADVTGIPGTSFIQVAFSQNKTVIYIQQINGTPSGKMYKSTNGGTVWSALSSGPTLPNTGPLDVDYYAHLRCNQLGDVVGLCYTDFSSVAQMWTSPDGGSSWNTFDVQAAFGALVRYICFDMNHDGSVMLLVCGGYPTLQSKAWKSTDKGVTWVLITTLNDAASNSLEMCGVAPDGLGMIAVYNNIGVAPQELEYSTDGGGTWGVSNFTAFGSGVIGDWVASYMVPTITNMPCSTEDLPLDGTGTGTFSGVNSGTTTITTTLPNDVLVIGIHTETPSTVSTVTSISDVAGLTWHKRSSQTLTDEISGYDSNLEIWYAVAPSPLTGDVITVNLSDVVDDGSIVVFAASGMNTSTPFDTNVSLPLKQTSVLEGSPILNGVSTDTMNGMLFIFVASANKVIFTAATPGFGLTFIANVENEDGTNFSEQSAQGMAFSDCNLTNSTFIIAGNWPTWIAIADCLVAA